MGDLAYRQSRSYAWASNASGSLSLFEGEDLEASLGDVVGSTAFGQFLPSLSPEGRRRFGIGGIDAAEPAVDEPVAGFSVILLKLDESES